MLLYNILYSCLLTRFRLLMVFKLWFLIYVEIVNYSAIWLTVCQIIFLVLIHFYLSLHAIHDSSNFVIHNQDKSIFAIIISTFILLYWREKNYILCAELDFTKLDPKLWYPNFVVCNFISIKNRHTTPSKYNKSFGTVSVVTYEILIIFTYQTNKLTNKPISFSEQFKVLKWLFYEHQK